MNIYSWIKVIINRPLITLKFKIMADIYLNKKIYISKNFMKRFMNYFVKK
jgi:hypothetical protein